VTAKNGIRKAPGANCKAPTNLLILFTAGSLRGSSLQSAAKSCKAQCFRARTVPQGHHRKVHPYGGRPSVPPPVGLGRSPRCFGGAGKAEVKAQTARCALRGEYLIGAYAGRCSVG
jgi:hypothetical protein